MTHKKLVEIGKKWLWGKCDIVVTELTTWVSETPDVIGWKSGVSTLIECKTSRRDFLTDRHKFSRRMPEYGMGRYRYYLISQDTVCSIHEIPQDWGLLIFMESGSIDCAREAKALPPLQPAQSLCKMLTKEMTILVSCIRRIGQNPPDGISVKAYRYKTKCRASIGVKED